MQSDKTKYHCLRRLLYLVLLACLSGCPSYFLQLPLWCMPAKQATCTALVVLAEAIFSEPRRLS